MVKKIVTFLTKPNEKLKKIAICDPNRMRSKLAFGT